MNALYTAGTRQASSIQADLALMSEGKSTPAIQGQILTTLNAFSRVIDDYDNMAKKELDMKKREKALSRVTKFKDEYKHLKIQFDTAKRQGSEKARAELLSAPNGTATTSSHSSTPSISTTTARYRSNVPPSPIHESPFALPAPSSPLYPPSTSALYPPGTHGSASSKDREREDFALHEHSFLQRSENQIDDFLTQGRAVLTSLVEQRTVLSGTKRRLLAAGETLGLSRQVIGWVERRSAQDAWIFAGGCVGTLGMFGVIYYYLG